MSGNHHLKSTNPLSKIWGPFLSTKSYITKKGVHKGAGRFDKAKLQRILTNVTYTGKIAHKGKIYPGEHQAIIDAKTFDRVQEIIAGNGNGSSKTARNKHGALLKGLLYCASCGAAMAHTYTKKKNRLYRYYVCTTAQKQGKEACSTPALPAQEIEDFVVEQIRQLAADPEMIEQVFAEAEKQRKANIPRLKAEQKRLQRERQHKQARIRELVAAVGASPEPMASFTGSLQELESAVIQLDQRLAEIQTELTSISSTTTDHADLTAALSAFGPVWEELYPAEKTRMVNLVVERVSNDARTDEIDILFSAAMVPTLPTGCLSAE
jgi:site-specific DNA recombinase